MAFTCANCRKAYREPSHKTVTGRDLCTSCNDELFGASAALMMGEGVAGAVVTGSLYSRLRAWRRTTGR
ncbi:MAG TPA: hypothetical protein VGN54_10720 [Mycobacteriales bacterium]|jgi:hypothetical protein|nr:hypothetical protein [Mycobacteriales bacterium]